MFKRNKDTEKINLLETELGTAIKMAAGNKTRSENAGLGIMLGCVAGAALIVGGAWLGMSFANGNIEDEITEIEEYLESPAVKQKLDHREKLLDMRDVVDAYAVRMENSYDAYYSQPVVNGTKFDTLQEILDKTAESLDLDVDKCYISTPSYSEGTFTYKVQAAGSEDFVQKLPSIYIDNICDEEYEDNKGYYGAASYEGYKVLRVEEVEDSGELVEYVEFNVAVGLEGRESAYHPEETESSDEDAA
jgi:type IV pilus assembly protein PilM